MGFSVLVLKDKKKIIINSSKNDAIAEFIPHAKQLEHNGEKLIAIPYGVDESIVLRNMGFNVPEPIKEYYD